MPVPGAPQARNQDEPMSEHICSPGCTHGVTPENEKDIKEEFQESRRRFLREAMLVGGGAVSLGTLGIDRKSVV